VTGVSIITTAPAFLRFRVCYLHLSSYDGKIHLSCPLPSREAVFVFGSEATSRGSDVDWPAPLIAEPSPLEESFSLLLTSLMLAISISTGELLHPGAPTTYWGSFRTPQAREDPSA